ncbi:MULTISPECIES: DUF1573 domain-containing protein [Polaribacter]|uniref:DUF1573 domain-containing protein n=1 Tax=Polaribacter sejongensis TaxID=985043 RepID=A0AAJ1QZ00_9FLAO|nr:MULTISPECIES: DUF1573 domain-containing protein [Polaribacter]AUC23682.1 hypothetical protein BTO15_16970 [Polaribacter sejongensis]MDN3620715.1 DUF1573 domain-containing protein [Polaribacter undariae]UWD32105.1 DUF1573 domain-containing protein [Polaribacter undariae]
MKKITILLAFVITASFFTACKDGGSAVKKVNQENLDNAASRDNEIKKGTALISLDKTIYDFGTVNEGDLVETSFVVTNSGKTDLVITNAQGSCGCTVPTWPKAPIKPGETGTVDVKFNTNGRPNRQQKTVTLTTNTEAGRQVLTIKGSVTPKAK